MSIDLPPDGRACSHDLTLAGLTIGFFTSIVDRGGSERLVADAMEACCSAGAKVVCWSARGAAIRSFVSPFGNAVTHIDWPTASTAGDRPVVTPAHAARLRPAPALWRNCTPAFVRRLVGFKRDVDRLARQFRAVAPDLLFVNVNGSEAASVAGVKADLPVVNCYHLSYTPERGSLPNRLIDRHLRRSTLLSSTVVIHTSEAARMQWCSALKTSLDVTEVIYNGVEDVPLVPRAVKRAELGLPDSVVTFAVPGRLHPIKGHTYLIEALRQLPQLDGNARILICGDGELREELEDAVQRHRLQRSVVFLGWRDDLPAILSASDCVVLPSIESENMSVAVLEALTVGTPAIVTSVGGMPEAIRDGVTGFVVPPADPSSLAAAIGRGIADPSTLRRMGDEARADALKRFTRQRMKSEYVRMFRHVVDGRSGGRRKAASPVTAVSGSVN